MHSMTCVLVLAMSAPSFSDAADGVPMEVNREQVPEFVKRIGDLHRMESELRQAGIDAQLGRRPDDAPRAIARRHLEALERHGMAHGHPGDLAAQGYRMRLSHFLHQTENTKRVAFDLAVTESWSGEALAVLAYIPARRGDVKSALVYRTLWVDLFPLSRAREQVDLTMDVYPEGAILADAGGPIIPRVNRDLLEQVASVWETAGRFHEAAIAYREAIYGVEYVQFERAYMVDGWLSANAAELWLRAAESDWRSRRHAEAFEALAKGMIFGRETHFAKGKALAERFARSLEEQDVFDDVPDRLDAEQLLKIISLYREMNAHPRALWLLEEHRGLFDEDWEAAWNEVAEEWLNRVGGYLAGYLIQEGKIHLFGHDIFPEENRLKVRVGPALSEEALKAVARALKDNKD